MLSFTRRPGALRFWCLDCEAEAGLSCHGHRISPAAGLLQQRREQEAKQAVALLERTTKIHRDTVQQITSLAPTVQAELEQQVHSKSGCAVTKHFASKNCTLRASCQLRAYIVTAR